MSLDQETLNIYISQSEASRFSKNQNPALPLQKINKRKSKNKLTA
jgi:hypothetical protein